LHRQQRREHAIGRRLYSHLSKLGRTVVTTNYDEWLDDELPAPPPNIGDDDAAPDDSAPTPRRVYYKTEDLTAAHLNKENAVIHLHGSVRHPEGMILTTQQYVQHYANDRRTRDGDTENLVLTFLEDLFKNKTVLFIGYGLDQPCGRSSIARPHGVRLGVTMRVHRVRIVRAYTVLRTERPASS
jgi:hypothetical protein